MASLFNDHPSRAHGYISFDELSEQLGLVIQPGNGLDAMLLAALRQRSEVTAAELNNGIVETTCALGFHKQQETQKDTSAVFPPERTVELFENAVSCARDFYRGEELYDMLHNGFELTIQEIREHGYLSDQELTEICRVPQQVLEGGMTIRDVLPLDGLPEGTSLTPKNSVFLVPLEDLKLLTDTGKEDFAALLDARVSDIRVDEGTPELLLEGAEASELKRLHDELEAHKEAERAIGPAVG